MQIMSLKHMEIHWRDDGNSIGKPVVFANSLGTDLRIWDRVVEQLPARFRAIRFDKRGHGLSSCPLGPYTIDDLTDDIEQLLDHLQIETCIFVGVSIGGMIGQNLAALRPGLVERLVLSNTATAMGEAQMWSDRIAAIKAGGISPLANAILERWFAADFLRQPELVAWRNMLVRTPQEGYIGCCAAIAAADLTDLAKKLKLPVLAIAGSEDKACPPDTVQNTVAKIEDAQYAVLEGVGHLPCIEAPDRFLQLLSAFLGNQKGRTNQNSSNDPLQSD